MNKNLLLLCALIFLLLIPAAGFGENRQELIEQMASGSINWSTATILSKGIGAPPQKSYGKPQARPLALRAARLDAMRNILEAVQGVRIDSTTVVRNFATESDVILAKVEGMTCHAAAKKLGVHSVTVKRWAKANGITALLPRGKAAYANRWEEWTATVLRPVQTRQMREYLAAGGLEG